MVEKTPIEMIGILPDQEFTLAKDFIVLGEKLNCISKVRFAPAHKTWKCVYSRKNPSRVLYTVECTDEMWHIKACLWNIDFYQEVLNGCSEKIKDIIVNSYNCKSCNSKCQGGAEFTFEEIHYKKCIGCCFYFSNLNKDDYSSLLSLIEKEYEASSITK